MSALFSDRVDVPSLPVDTGVGASPGAVTIPESCSATATVMRSEAVDWSVADYKSKFADCFDVRRFNAMVLDSRNAIM